MIRRVLVEEEVLRGANRRLSESTVRSGSCSSSLRVPRMFVCTCDLGEMVMVIAQVRGLLVDVELRQVERKSVSLIQIPHDF